MTRSMTAFGRATGTVNGKEIAIEIKSVNSRYFDCTVKVSRMFGFLEEKIKSYLQSCGIARGKVEVSCSINVIDNIGMEIHLDDAYTASYIDALRRLRDTYGLRDDISVMTVAQNRDIFTVLKPEEDLEKDWQDVLPVLSEAVDAFQTMRANEGENLRRDLLGKNENLRAMAAKVASMADRATEGYRRRLETRLRQVLADYQVNPVPDEARIVTECALFADKTAIDEELVRLSSHFDAFVALFSANEPIGRKADFLLQEMNRETNTIGSKCSDIEITSLVVEMKSELEKIREQIQNIE